MLQSFGRDQHRRANDTSYGQMPGEIAIRAARLEDAEAVDEVVCASWEWAYSDFMPPDLLARGSLRGRRVSRTRQDIACGTLFLVAELEARGVVGAAIAGTVPSLDGFDAEMTGLYVHPRSARRGAGEALFKEFVRLCEERGHKSLCVHTLSDNAIGRGFYEKMGGRLVAEDEWNGLRAVWYGWP